MKKLYIVGLGLILSGVVAGCGSSGSDDSEQVKIPDTSSKSTITTLEDAKQAAAALSQVNSSSNIGLGFANTQNSQSSSFSRASIPSQSVSCANGGTYNFGGDYSDDGSNSDLTTSYNNCNQGGMTMNGGMTLKQSTNGNNISMDMSMKNFEMTQGSNSYKMNFDMDIETNSNFNPMNMNLNGTITLDSSGYDYNIGYQNFKMQLSGQYVNLSGTYSVESNSFSCYNGTYTIETVDDLYLNNSGYSSGTMKVNGATYTYSGSSVDITLADGTTSTLSQNDLTTATCN